jgi:hypothetical protein
MNALELANALVNTDYTPLKAEAAAMLRRLQDKLDIETAYNAIHIERIQALRSALTEILENDGSRRIYSAGGLYDARQKAEALLREAGIQDA